ncbi:MAG TPA: uracil-DNA glycosylase [Candidatus Bathyarchaeia archaeon]|nr:uracil-DNA glycosylase [Candidatus Bathyarchaeia archaeon]
MSITELNEQIKKCRKCRLWRDAKNAVPGEGSFHAKVMLVGQNPGEEEDRTGRPFVGRAGKFLNAVLNRNGINRGDLFITNVVKHKTPLNRTPKPDEIAACMPYLATQIMAIKPEIIVLMGAVAWQVPRNEGITYVETYHPSAAMRFSKMRKKFEEDFNALKGRL